MDTLESIPCPNCTPQDAHDRGQTLTGFWDVYPSEGVKRCANCRHEEPYSPRSPRPDTGATQSQVDAFQSVRSYFEGRVEDVTGVEKEHSEHGPMRLRVSFGEGLTNHRIRLHITRRGKIVIRGTSGIGYSPDVEHVAKMVGGHVWKYAEITADEEDGDEENEEIDADPGDQLALSL